MRILSVIVLYHCLLKDSRTYKTLNPSSKDLLVFDNSENPQDIAVVAPKAVYVHNESNIGLSVCYNQAAKYAREYGYDWLLFLDQDTDFTDVSVEDYAKAAKKHPDCQMIAPMVKCGEYTMSPMNFNHHYAVLSKNSYVGKLSVRNMSVINSGMCVSVKAFEKCRGYNEQVFLDYSDHEFVGRYKKYFENICVLENVARQDFSARTDSKEASLKRFGLFCKSIKGCEKNSITASCEYAFVILKRMLSLMVRFRTVKPCIIAYNNYFVENEGCIV